MGVLGVKLMRDLWRLRGQALAVALVVASGVALMVMSLSALASLRTTADAYYQRHGFAEVFAGLRRAPERLATEIAAIPGVQIVETRVRSIATLDVPGMVEPVTAHLLSLPDTGAQMLNRLALRAGRLPAPRRADEAVLLAPFAEAHGLVIGDRLSVLLDGARRELRVVGLALSPEYVYAMAPGALMPDDRRFGVLWMSRAALAAGYDLDGAFNDVSLTLERGTDPRAVIDRLDRLLDRHGGAGAVARADQPSHWFLMNEFAQLKQMATILPAIFLAAGAFLTNTVLARLIEIERREISLLKAFGYGNAAIGLHYALMALAMAAAGVLLGWGLGVALGRWNTGLYAEFFRFPFLHYTPGTMAFVISGAVSLGAALMGAMRAVGHAVRLHPAEAMRPPMPESGRGALLPEAVTARMDHPTRIVLRQVVRAPVRAATTVIGVALAVAVLVMAMQWIDAIRILATSHFAETQHQDATLGFLEPVDRSALPALGRLPGVMAVEPVRIAAAELSAGPVRHRGALTGLMPGSGLESIHDVRGWRLPVPEAGLVLGTMLAGKLGVGPGDRVQVRFLTGRRAEIDLPVAATVETWMGMPAWVALPVLDRALGEGAGFEAAHIRVDPAEEARLFAALKKLPGLASVTFRRNAIDKLNETMGETILIFSGFFVAFAGMLAIGTVYNATRVSLSERARELATLRVLGFRRAEISYILLAEAGLLMLIALPLGCLAGWGLVLLIGQGMATELFRVPPVVTPLAMGKAVAVILAAGLLAALIVRRRLDHLDLIGVLKTRE